MSSIDTHPISIESKGGIVIMWVTHHGSHIMLVLSPERARDIATKLVLAAEDEDGLDLVSKLPERQKEPHELITDQLKRIADIMEDANAREP